MEKINFIDATLEERAYVEINGQKYYVNDATYLNGTDLNAQTFNSMQNNIEQEIKNKTEISTISLFSSEIYNMQFSTWQRKNITNLQEEYNFGNKLIYDNGVVKIGQGVKKVRVGGVLTFYFKEKACDAIAFLQKNDVVFTQGYSAGNLGEKKQISLPNKIIAVNENDEIKLGAELGATGQYDIFRTYLIVEVVE